MPIENTASSKVTTFWSPPRFSLAKPVKVVRNTEPKNHIHDTPSSDRKTVRLPCAWRRLASVSLNGFQLMTSFGTGAGERGTKAAEIRPTMASAIDTPAT